MVKFKVGYLDCTKYEDLTKHAVNQVDVYEEWTDGDWIDHRVIARTRIIGTVTLNFPRQWEMYNFLGSLRSYRNADGYYPIEVWCDNADSVISTDAFLDITGDTKWDVTCPRYHQSVTIQIVGR